MNDLKNELLRDFLGFALLAAGVGLVHLGAHYHLDKEADAGYGFIGASLLALSVRHPDDPPKLPLLLS